MADTNITEKLIETRIINRHDTLENWKKSGLKLKDGEIALAYIEKEEVNIDAAGNKVTTVVPTYLMKIGQDGKTFSELRWLAAPASDVYAWAKTEKLEYNNLPETLRTNINAINNILTGVGMGTEDTYKTVVDYVTAAIEALDSAAAPTDGSIPVSVVQTDGKVTVNYAKLTNANIAENANIAMSKVENLTQIHEDLYGDGTAGKPGIKANVEFILNELGKQGKIMEFIGVSSTDPTTGVVTINGAIVTDFENGDTVVYADTGKEYIHYNGIWNEIGYASDVEEALDEFAKKVLKDGLDSTRTESLEAEFIRRTEALETTVNENHKPRIETIEDTLAEKVPQLDETNPVLKINSEVLIFDCGTANPRTYLGE